MKKNNKGFVLVETLIVSVAIAAIFSIIYTNIVPVLGDYERTEVYDDLDTKYIAHWMRMLVINKGNKNLLNAINASTGNNPFKIKVDKTAKEEDINYETKRYAEVSNSCNNYFIEPNTCLNFFKQFNVTKLYIVPYSLVDFKNNVKNNISEKFGDSPGFQEYVNSLSKFNKSSEDVLKVNQRFYRIIIEVERNTNLKETEDYFTSYATIELNRGVDSVLQNRP